MVRWFTPPAEDVSTLRAFAGDFDYGPVAYTTGIGCVSPSGFCRKF